MLRAIILPLKNSIQLFASVAPPSLRWPKAVEIIDK